MRQKTITKYEKYKQEDFLDGACNVFASAFKARHPRSEIWCYTTEGFPIDGLIHCFCVLDGMYYDALGCRGSDLDWLFESYEQLEDYEMEKLSSDELFDFNMEYLSFDRYSHILNQAKYILKKLNLY